MDSMACLYSFNRWRSSDSKQKNLAAESKYKKTPELVQVLGKGCAQRGLSINRFEYE